MCRFHDGNKIVEFRLKSKTGQFAHKNIQKTGQKVSALMREIGFHDVQVIKDLARKDRVVTGML